MDRKLSRNNQTTEHQAEHEEVIKDSRLNRFQLIIINSLKGSPKLCEFISQQFSWTAPFE